ncbi:MAG: Thioredoxin [archaeon GW2011_AR13]|nr:MAG: Thioredoxin [archaeon GW2011_AR13]HIG94682.1 thioredoxin [Nanoarchaeota archaeon]HIH63478.1 thioredoxin [Nanoarchaeota archaeon]HIJ09408.1 thioredoxin [Nanoarchaeota archaeon]
MVNNDIVPELTKQGFDKYIKEGLVLVDFFAEWCMPCVMMGPIVDELAEKFKGRIKVGKINLEENSDLAQKYDVSSIPNFVLFKNGEVVEQLIGVHEIEDFEEIFKKFM